MPTPAITKSLDWQRIQALATREVLQSRGEELSDELTPVLRRDDARNPLARLKWQQAFSLWEIYKCRGAYLGLPPGQGKTLISFLAAYILAAKHPVLILPAGLRSKTQSEFHKLSLDWVAPDPMPEIVGVEALTLEHNVDLLTRMHAIKPIDMVFIDEVDVLRNTGENGGGSATKRVDRLKHESIPEDDLVADLAAEDGERGQPPRDIVQEVDEWCAARGIPFICATGTGTRFSILDFAHMLIWAREDGAPVPLDQAELQRWAEALDFKKDGKRRLQKPGALLELIDVPKPDAYETQLERARRTFMRRLTLTPGVVITDGSDCDQPLTINLLQAPDDPLIDEIFEGLLEMKLPDGRDIIDGLSFWRAMSEGGCGGYGIWKDPQPPEEWRAARRAYASLVLSVIQESAWGEDPKDTALAVAKAFPDNPIVQRWRALKPTYKPKPDFRWVSSSVVDYAARWAREHPQGALIFTKSLAVGEAVAHAAGLRFFHAGGLADDGVSIDTVEGRTAVASIDSNSRGRNMQDRFNRGLILGMPAPGDETEQLICRLHRSYQLKPVVWDVLLTSSGSRHTFNKALQAADFVLKTQSQRQKILRAEIVDHTIPSDAVRWRPRK